MRTGAAILVLLLAAVLAAPWALPAPEAMDLASRFDPPSAAHLLGTDDLGRDIAARLAQGGLVSLGVAALTALMAALIGTIIGLLAGYHGGWADSALMRLTDGVMSLPLLPLLIVMAAADPAKLGVPPGLTGSEVFAVLRPAVIIACIAWTGVARLVRAATLSVRTRDYVRAAEAMGARPMRIMLRHILPNVASPIVVATTLSVGNIILIESALSFLGLGIRPPLASWGNMLTGAMDVVWSAPLLAFWPGAAIFATVLGFNLLGDGLQKALDPKG
ncbi:NAD synthetase [Magnetospirillum sp. ME-1]|uniref:ABC transporter permease n=1 Tax=Magnetospirillum sp. ME-1 TaxID=1639348 RepID=UPI000A17F853|nr:ABC transporter permease [Magnetospirillum sp. ME-1]ARJ67790.1 NAD synthetase [Magnetospirillum sp. ME-1]